MYEPDVSLPHIHLSVCLKSNTHVFPALVPIHIIPFAASTVGVPIGGAPKSEDAFCDGLAYMCPEIERSRVHMNTSRSCAPSFSAAAWMFVRLDEREMAEKCEGSGDARWRPTDCELTALPGVGVKERRRETVGCRNGRAVAFLEGVPFGVLLGVFVPLSSGVDPLGGDMSRELGRDGPDMALSDKASLC